MPRDYSLASQPPTAGQRLPEYARDEEWIRAFLRAAQVAHIATQWDDQPFVTPTTFWFDEANHRIIFHSNLAGRVRANAERHPKVCLEASEMGRLLPSNVALEFSVQYRSVMVFGTVRVLEADNEKREALNGLLKKYFPKMKAGASTAPSRRRNSSARRCMRSRSKRGAEKRTGTSAPISQRSGPRWRRSDSSKEAERGAEKLV